MYNELFGLEKDPFLLTPDPSFLFLTDQHREALSGLTLALLQRKGLVVLSGGVGTGKTTLLARVLRFLPASRLQFAMIVNPTLTASEFLEMALLDFGVADIPSSKAHRLSKLLHLILEGQREGKVTVLIVDEAHLLGPDVFEEIRMLCNMEDAEDRCLQILLVGQTEIDKILARDDMRHMEQRIGVRLKLGPLAEAEVGEYIRHRWLRAGGTGLPFTPDAIEAVAGASGNIPRLINLLCNNSLTAAVADRTSRVEVRHIQEAAATLDLDQHPNLAGFVPLEVPAAVIEAPSPIVPELNPSRWSRLTGKLRPAPSRKQLLS
jgi:general secretion pathway protein A